MHVLAETKTLTDFEARSKWKPQLRNGFPGQERSPNWLPKNKRGSVGRRHCRWTSGQIPHGYSMAKVLVHFCFHEPAQHPQEPVAVTMALMKALAACVPDACRNQPENNGSFGSCPSKEVSCSRSIVFRITGLLLLHDAILMHNIYEVEVRCPSFNVSPGVLHQAPPLDPQQHRESVSSLCPPEPQISSGWSNRP